MADGSTLCAPSDVLARAGELWFDPVGASSWQKRPGAGLTEEVLASVKLCNADLRRQMLENVVLAGGARSMTGLETRLTKELVDSVPGSIRPGTVPLPDYMPANTFRNAAFVGGTILAKTVFPLNQYVTKRDYHEHGPSLRTG
jgi:actin-related protein